jgi:hypothetical protein
MRRITHGEDLHALAAEAAIDAMHALELTEHPLVQAELMEQALRDTNASPEVREAQEREDTLLPLLFRQIDHAGALSTRVELPRRQPSPPSHGPRRRSAPPSMRRHPR